MSETGEGDQEVQTTSYKINKSQGRKVTAQRIVSKIVITLYGM